MAANDAYFENVNVPSHFVAIENVRNSRAAACPNCSIAMRPPERPAKVES